jgi:arginine deiminase
VLHIVQAIALAAVEILMKTRVRAEWHKLNRVMIHTPGYEMFFGLLEPTSFLYERSFSFERALEEHHSIQDTLTKEFGVKVHVLKSIVVEKAKRSGPFRKLLIQKIMSALAFTGTQSLVKQVHKNLEKRLAVLDEDQLFDIWLLSPEVRIRQLKGTRVILPDVTVRAPLANLHFARDQQAVADMGVIVGRMSKPQRLRETDVTRFGLETLGAEIRMEIKPPGTLEGGDFIPAKDFALIGVGDRTSFNAVAQLMTSGIGFDELAVVHQPFHPAMSSPDPMVTMHLDTYFNIAADGVAVGCEVLLRQTKVDVYQRSSKGKYGAKQKTTLLDYMKQKSFNIIDISTFEQLCYASNFLCIRDGTILAVNVARNAKAVLETWQGLAQLYPKKYAPMYRIALEDYHRLRRIGRLFPNKKEIHAHDIDAYELRVTNLSGGYGAIHCLTCSLSRG